MESNKVSFRGLYGNKKIDSNLDGFLTEISGLAPNGPVESPRWEVYNTGNSVPKNYTSGAFSEVEIINEFWHNRISFGNDANNSVDLKRWLVFLQDKSSPSGDYYLYGTSYNGTSWILNSTPILQIANADWNANYEVLFTTINDQDVAVLLTDNGGDARLYYLYDDLLYPSNIFPYVNKNYFEQFTRLSLTYEQFIQSYPNGFNGVLIDDKTKYIAFILAYALRDGSLIKETQPYILELIANSDPITYTDSFDYATSSGGSDDIWDSSEITSPFENIQLLNPGSPSRFDGFATLDITIEPVDYVLSQALSEDYHLHLIKYKKSAPVTDGDSESTAIYTVIDEVKILDSGTNGSGSTAQITHTTDKFPIEKDDFIALVLLESKLPAFIKADLANNDLVFSDLITMDLNQLKFNAYTDITLKQSNVSDANLELALATYNSNKYDTGQEYSQFSKDELGDPIVFMCLPKNSAEDCLNEVYYEVGQLQDGEFTFSQKEDDIPTGRVLTIENESHHQLAANNIRSFGKNPVLVQQIRNYALPGIEWWAFDDSIGSNGLIARENSYGKAFNGYTTDTIDIIVEVDIETSKGTFTRQNTLKLAVPSGLETPYIPDVLSYPDKNATKLRLYRSGNLIDEYPLTKSSSLNLAYNYEYERGINISTTASAPSNINVNESNLVEHNKLRISTVDERLFPLLNTYDDFTGEILSVVDNSNETSEGQFGQYPLYVLGKETIYAASPGNDTLFSRFVVITDDTGLKSKQAFCTYKGKLFFVSDNGIHIISGSTIQEIDFSLEELSTYQSFLGKEEFYVSFNISTREVLFSSDAREIFIFNEKYNIWYSIDSATLWSVVDQRSSLKKMFEVNGQTYILTNGFSNDTYDPSFLLEWRKGVNTNSFRVKFNTHPIVLSDYTIYKRLKKAIWEANLVVDTPSFIYFKGYRTSSDDIDKEYDLLSYFVNVASIELENISGKFIKGEKVVLGTTNIRGVVIDFTTPIIEVNISRNIVDIQGQVLFGEKSRATATIISNGITYVERQSTIKNLLFKSNYGSMQAFSLEVDITVKDRGYLSDLLFEFDNRQRSIKGPGLRLDQVIPPLADNLTATLSGISAVTLNWNDNTDEESGFQIERSLSATEDFQLVSVIGSDITSFEDTTVVNGETYYYRVRPLGVNSLYSNVASIEVPVLFESMWNTGNTSTGSSSSSQVKLPLIVGGSYDFLIDWGDESSIENITSWNQSEVTHTYLSSGNYDIKIAGTIEGFAFEDGGDKSKITEISSFGNLVLTTDAVFYGCNNLNISATDTPDVSSITTINNFFNGCSSLEFNSSINQWSWGNLTLAESVFNGCSLFNQDLDLWDMSLVTSLQNCFSGASVFNGDITNWDLSNLESLTRTFQNASNFNQDISGWRPGNLTILRQCFLNATSFNRDINNWDVSGVGNFSNCFEGATSFNQDLDLWDTSGATVLTEMFENASSFNGDVTTWTSLGTTVSTVRMFKGATVFNQNISGWDVSLLEDIRGMFQDANAFDQDLGGWDIQSVTDAETMFSGIALSTANYNSLLIGWESNTHNNNINFDGGNSTYTLGGAAETARTTLDVTDGWSITDGGGV